MGPDIPHTPPSRNAIHTISPHSPPHNTNRTAEYGGRRPEARGQRPEVGGRRPEIGGWRTGIAAGGRRSAGLRAEVGGQRSEGGPPHPGGITAISRWLSAATPPDRPHHTNRIPEGCQPFQLSTSPFQLYPRPISRSTVSTFNDFNVQRLQRSTVSTVLTFIVPPFFTGI